MLKRAQRTTIEKHILQIICLPLRCRIPHILSYSEFTMCQDFMWTCNLCRTTQKCILHCLTNRYGFACNGVAIMSLSQDAPPPVCQRCGAIGRTRDSNICRPLSEIRVPEITANRASRQVTWLPPSSDIFWMRPETRLPDIGKVLRTYDQRRDEILRRLDDRGDCVIKKEPDAEGNDSACEAAWRQLKQDMTER